MFRQQQKRKERETNRNRWNAKERLQLEAQPLTQDICQIELRTMYCYGRIKLPPRADPSEKIQLLHITIFRCSFLVLSSALFIIFSLLFMVLRIILKKNEDSDFQLYSFSASKRRKQFNSIVTTLFPSTNSA